MLSSDCMTRIVYTGGCSLEHGHGPDRFLRPMSSSFAPSEVSSCLTTIHDDDSNHAGCGLEYCRERCLVTGTSSFALMSVFSYVSRSQMDGAHSSRCDLQIYRDQLLRPTTSNFALIALFSWMWMEQYFAADRDFQHPGNSRG